MPFGDPLNGTITASLIGTPGNYAIDGSGLTPNANYVLVQAAGNASALIILSFTTPNLQATLAAQPVVTVAADPVNASDILSQMNALQSTPAPTIVTLNLGPGNYTDLHMNLPSNVTVGVQSQPITGAMLDAAVAVLAGNPQLLGLDPSTIISSGALTAQRAGKSYQLDPAVRQALAAITQSVLSSSQTIQNALAALVTGHSPALTVTSGTVIVLGIAFSTPTDSPTILVTGGSLALRANNVQGTTGGAQPAVLISGGTADLGTAADPGNSTINVNGAGLLISNTTSDPVSAAGNVFQTDWVQLTDAGSIAGLINAGQDSSGHSLVSTGASVVWVGRPTADGIGVTFTVDSNGNGVFGASDKGVSVTKVGGNYLSISWRKRTV